MKSVVIRSRRASPAFTLMELLVVIAILTLLASLLLPALVQGQASAYRARCQSNLRQLGLALQLYVSDHGVFPTANGFAVDNWKPALGAYLGPESDRAMRWPLLYCPAEPNLAVTSRTYGYNGFGFSTDLGLFGQFQPEGYIPVKDTEVSAPANMIGIGDGFAKAGVDQVLAGSDLLQRNAAVSGEPEIIQKWAKIATRRHQDRANILFCDGHVELLPNRTLFLDDSDEALRRWNRDNQAHTEDTYE